MNYRWDLTLEFAVGPLPLITTAVAICFYIRQLVQKQNDAFTSMITSFLIAVGISAYLFYVFFRLSFLNLIILQLISVSICLALLFLCLRNARGRRRNMLEKPVLSKDRALFMGTASLLSVIVFDLIFLNAPEECVTAKCISFSALFGYDHTFQVFYMSALVGTIFLSGLLISILHLAKFRH